MLASGTKSFVGVMAIAAVEDKLLSLMSRLGYDNRMEDRCS